MKVLVLAVGFAFGFRAITAFSGEWVLLPNVQQLQKWPLVKKEIRGFYNQSNQSVAAI